MDASCDLAEFLRERRKPHHIRAIWIISCPAQRRLCHEFGCTHLFPNGTVRLALQQDAASVHTSTIWSTVRSIALRFFTACR